MKDKRHKAKKNTTQSNNKAQLSEIFFPKKYEKLSMLLYMMIIPFFIGHLFLFTYVSKFNYDIYTAVCSNNNELLTWCMGYEGFAIVVFSILLIGALINLVQQQNKIR